MKKAALWSLLLAWSMFGCIGDDLVFDEVEPELRITSMVDTIGLNSDFQFRAAYLNNVGLEESVSISWQSSNDSILRISNDGLATALALGSAQVKATYQDGNVLFADSLQVAVGTNTVTTVQTRRGSIATTSTYALEGDFTITQQGDDLLLEFGADYRASTALPGLYVYLTNNRNTTSGAYEIGAVEVFSGAHSYTIPNIGIEDFGYVLYFCKPFNVKVGDGEIIE